MLVLCRYTRAQLSRVFTTIFNFSLTQSTVIPVSKKSTAVSHKAYCPVTLTPIITKCLERLVINHIRTCLPSSFDPHQFVYSARRSAEDALAITLHTALSHLEHRESYVRMLFIDYSSAFNTIIPDILVSKMSGDSPHSPAPGCVLSPLLYSVLTTDCRPAHSSNSIGNHKRQYSSSTSPV